MLKNISRLECVIGEKVYHLTCDNDSPLHHVKESLFQFLKYVGALEDKLKEAADAQAAAKLEESVVESAIPIEVPNE